MKSSKNAEVLVVFFVGLSLFTVGLGQRDFLGLECRFGLFAKAMWENGITLYPMLYGQPYADYPAMHTLLMYWSSLLFGQVTITAAVLPTAIAAAITLALTYLIGTFHSQRLALWAVVLELGTFAFFAYARNIAMDHFVATLTALCFYLVHLWTLRGGHWRLCLIVIAWLAGFALRGPIGMVIPAAVVFAYFAAERHWRMALAMGIAAAVSLALASATLFYLAYLTGGDALLQLVWTMQVSTRFGDSHAKPVYYYLVNSLGDYTITMPIALLLLWISRKRLLQPSACTDGLSLLRPCAAWFLIILIGMSIPKAKAGRYILAIAPAISLIAAHLFCATWSMPWLGRCKSLLLWLCRAMPWIGLVGIWCGFWLIRHNPWGIEISPLPVTAVLLGLAFASWWLLNKPNRLSSNRELVMAATGVLTFIAIQILVAEPASVALMSSKPFVQQVEALREPHETLIFYHGPDSNDIKYMVHVERLFTPQFIMSPEALLAWRQPACLLVEKKSLAKLPPGIWPRSRIVLEGSLAHKPYVVIKLK